MERKILRRKGKAPQASQARPAPHFVGRLLRGQSPRESLLAMRGDDERSEVGEAFPVYPHGDLPYFFKKSLYGLDFRRLFCYNS